jgi:hypothetical protein
LLIWPGCDGLSEDEEDAADDDGGADADADDDEEEEDDDDDDDAEEAETITAFKPFTHSSEMCVSILSMRDRVSVE